MSPKINRKKIMPNSPLLGSLVKRDDPKLPDNGSYVGGAGNLDEATSETIEVPRAELEAIKEAFSAIQTQLDDLINGDPEDSKNPDQAASADHENSVKSLQDEIGGMSGLSR